MILINHSPVENSRHPHLVPTDMFPLTHKQPVAVVPHSSLNLGGTMSAAAHLLGRIFQRGLQRENKKQALKSKFIFNFSSKFCPHISSPLNSLSLQQPLIFIEAVFWLLELKAMLCFPLSCLFLFVMKGQRRRSRLAGRPPRLWLYNSSLNCYIKPGSWK